VIKVSAVDEQHRVIKAPAIVFDDQEDVIQAFQQGELEKDFIAVVRNQGPRANGMPELHKLTPPLGVLQGKGYAVALVTDGRMSGASGKVPAAIHLSPEAVAGGPIGKIRDGDIIELDANQGILKVLVDDQEFAQREASVADLDRNQWGMGRELFDGFRQRATTPEQGGMSILLNDET
jgi:phosphogluconate dehydratase